MSLDLPLQANSYGAITPKLCWVGRIKLGTLECETYKNSTDAGGWSSLNLCSHIPVISLWVEIKHCACWEPSSVVRTAWRRRIKFAWLQPKLDDICLSKSGQLKAPKPACDSGKYQVNCHLYSVYKLTNVTWMIKYVQTSLPIKYFDILKVAW